MREGKLDEAEKALDKAAKLAPSNPDVLYIQGMLYLRQSNWDKAETVLQKADQVDAEPGANSFGPRHGALQ